MFQIVESLFGQRRLDARFQYDGIERLGKAILRSHLQAARHAIGLVKAGKDDHGDIAQKNVFFHMAQHFIPAHPGQSDIEQDHVDFAGLRQPQADLTVLRGHQIIAIFIQQLAQ